RSVCLLTPIVHIECGERDDRGLQGVHGRWMHHHRSVNAVECATLKQNYFPAVVTHLFGWSADDAYGKAKIVRKLGGGNARARGHRGDDVVAAGVTDCG